MTSPSRRKLQTILRSTLRRIPSGLLSAGLLSAAAGTALAADPPVASPSVPGQSAVGNSFADPLQKLRQRSSQRRYERLKTQLPSVKEPQTGPPTGPRTGPLTGESAVPLLPADSSSKLSQVPPLAVSPRAMNQSMPRPLQSRTESSSVQLSAQQAPVDAPTFGVAEPQTEVESVPATATVAVPPVQSPGIEDTLSPPVIESPLTTDPRAAESVLELKKIGEIRPFADYDPRTEKDRQDGIPMRLPEEYSLTAAQEDVQPYSGRLMPDMVFNWEASNLYYRPLYFQDVQLERYGHTHHPLLQPFASVGKFGVQLVGLPYQMAIHPFHSRQYALGYYRPGDPAPRIYYQIPLDARAIAVQSAATLGGVFLIP